MMADKQKDYLLNLVRILAMTENQQQDLFVEWNLYEPKQQEAIIAEFHRLFQGSYTKTDLFEFLKNKLEIEGYWKKVGLA